ncbi:putative leucine-rich repeat receptor-like serine/threonine-protein kinase [Iris pallida]|uniref:Leucine-rich repeat receptor-like serine/threonine-protein kinase n=1 Tax=Iris pallida TaxID=29817 RepID=A0AAX6H9N0_IRIPA|nr:putative leucine-rich repeat receptor-like serine/threonine-protein kinase [Iris pallida]
MNWMVKFQKNSTQLVYMVELEYILWMIIFGCSVEASLLQPFELKFVVEDNLYFFSSK